MSAASSEPLYKPTIFLKEGYELLWYEIRSVLGQGGQGLTYLAFDNNLQHKVAIKEFFPVDLVVRDPSNFVIPLSDSTSDDFIVGLDRFINEARTLAQFKHPHIVRVHSVFEHNNTAYMVMEYEQGEDLSQIYRQKALSEEELLNIFLPILDGLHLVHEAKFIHRDAKPANIYIRKDRSPVLIDFGSARKVVGHTNSMTTMISYGYAPFEQYGESEDNQGPWTDIYALGASLHEALTGKTPPESMARGSCLMSVGSDPYVPLSVSQKGKYSQPFLRAIDKALMFHIKDRPQDVLSWRDMLTGKTKAQFGTELKFSDPATVQTAAHGFPPPAAARPDKAENAIAKLGGRLQSMLQFSWQTSIAIAVFLSVMAIVLYALNAQFSAKQSEQQKESMSELVASAELALSSGNVLSKDENSAYALYSKILKRDPRNRLAVARVHSILDVVRENIRQMTASGNFPLAYESIRQLRAINPGIKEVDSIFNEVKAAEARMGMVAPLLDEAEALMAKGQFMQPEGANAWTYFQRVLSIVPENEQALEGTEKIFEHYLATAQSEIGKGLIDQANGTIDVLQMIKPDAAPISELQQQVEAKQQMLALYDAAEKALEDGRIYSPADNNGLFLIKQYKSTFPGDNSIDPLVIRADRAIRGRFDKLVKNGRLEAAALLIRDVEKITTSDFTASLHADLARQISTKSEVTYFNETLDTFKKAFENRDMSKLKSLSATWNERHQFIRAFFQEYGSFSARVSNAKFNKKRHQGEAEMRIYNLVNKAGQSVQPSASWSHISVKIKKNRAGKWLVYW